MTVAAQGHQVGSLTEMHHEIAQIAPNCRSVPSLGDRACGHLSNHDFGVVCGPTAGMAPRLGPSGFNPPTFLQDP
jgi:hypothetical protein